MLQGERNAPSNTADFHGALHYIWLQGRPGSSIFFDSDILKLPATDALRAARDLRHFENLVAEACDECGSVGYAFSWLPNTAVAVIQTHAVPLAGGDGASLRSLFQIPA